MNKNFYKNIFKKLTDKQSNLLTKSYDLVGSILIFNHFPEELVKKEKYIGETLIENIKQVETVVKKTKKYSGKFRLPYYKIIAGKRKKETLHKENGCRFKLHIDNCYFSPRTSSERLRVSKKAKGDVLVMFSGIGVLPIEIKKLNKNVKTVYGVEINPECHKYALENVKLNKVNVHLFNEDVCNFKINKKFDSIFMPLPKNAENFLDVALKYSKKGTTIYLYKFLRDDRKDFEEEIKPLKVRSYTKCGAYSPGVWRTCVEIKI